MRNDPASFDNPRPGLGSGVQNSARAADISTTAIGGPAEWHAASRTGPKFWRSDSPAIPGVTNNNETETVAIKRQAARACCGVVFTVERFVFMDVLPKVVFLFFNAACRAQPSGSPHDFLWVRQPARRHWPQGPAGRLQLPPVSDWGLQVEGGRAKGLPKDPQIIARLCQSITAQR